MVDLLGSGRSDEPASDRLTAHASAAAQHQAVEQVGADQVILVGHTAGSALALRVTAPYDDIDAVVVTGFMHSSGPASSPLEPTLHRGGGPRPGWRPLGPGGRSIGPGFGRSAGRAVSVLGTGMLGTVLTRVLLGAGHRVTVWNRTAGKTDALVASGATRAPTPAEAVAASPIVIASVSTYDDVHALLTPAVDRLAGRTLVNLSSGTPEQARTLAAWAAEQGVRYLDGAAMSGTRLVGQPEALFLYSGDLDAYAAHEATLAALGRAVHLGADPGAASVYDTALLAMNMGVLSGFYQAVAMVGAAGVDAPTFASVAVDYLPFVTGLLPGHARQIDQRRYPGDDGTLEVYAAAMGHVVDTGRRQEIDVELPAAIAALIERGVAAGHRDDGLARLADVIADR